MNIILRTVSCRLLGIILLFAASGSQAITMLTLPGEFQPPGIVGTFPDDAGFSWISHRSPSNSTYFSWKFGGGADGGLVFDKAQKFREMTDTFIMFNQQTGLFSVGGGVSILQNMDIDMANLRMRHAGEIIDIGSGSGYDTVIPYLPDISGLGQGESGWAMDDAGNYHLLYRTRGVCADCEMTVHLYGAAVVPLPAAFWLFMSGMAGMILAARRRVLLEGKVG